MYLWETGPDSGVAWNEVPPTWSQIRFDAVDVLFITPFGLTKNNTFGLYTAADGKASLTNQFEWVVQNARLQNPKIKIIATQWYTASADGGTFSTLVTDDKIAEYANAVAKFLRQSQTTKYLVSGRTVSGRIDGWDVDLEGTCLTSSLPKTLSALRSKVDKQYQISICPAWLTDLEGVDSKSLDYVNMQNYDGGHGMDPKEYISTIVGLQPE